jgi:hypothetical protein
LSFLHAYNPVFSATFLEDAVIFPFYALGTFVKNQMSIAAWIHIWVFYFVPLVFISVLCQYHVVFIAMTLYYTVKSGIAIPSSLLFLLLNVALVIRGLLSIQMNFKVDFLISVKNVIGIEHVDCFW